MHNDYSTETIAQINKRFTQETGAKVKVQVQQWDGITDKTIRSLSSSRPRT